MCGLQRTKMASLACALKIWPRFPTYPDDPQHPGKLVTTKQSQSKQWSAPGMAAGAAT